MFKDSFYLPFEVPVLLLQIWIFLVQSGILKRIEEKKNERDSFELQIANVSLSHIDEREKNMVRISLVLWSCLSHNLSTR